MTTEEKARVLYAIFSTMYGVALAHEGGCGSCKKAPNYCPECGMSIGAVLKELDAQFPLEDWRDAIEFTTYPGAATIPPDGLGLTEDEKTWARGYLVEERAGVPK